MKSDQPKTNFVTFNAKNSLPIDWNDYIPNKFDEPDSITTYNQACMADSGSGQFVNNGRIYVLVAIFTNSIIRKYEDANGKLHYFPCGTFTWSEGEYRYNSKESESTTWQENLEWIKHKASITTSSTSTSVQSTTSIDLSSR